MSGFLLFLSFLPLFDENKQWTRQENGRISSEKHTDGKNESEIFG